METKAFTPRWRRRSCRRGARRRAWPLAPVRPDHLLKPAAEMCGPLFAKTTAAQVPVDGGNELVI